MNNWNELENQLRSWVPRQPSPRLKARLFPATVGAAASAAAARPVSPTTWNWLAPAMAIFLFGMFVAGRHPQGWSDLSGCQVASVVMSDPDMAAYSEASHHSDANMPPVARFAAAATASSSIFEWTKGSTSLTTAPPMLNTNSLLP